MAEKPKRPNVLLITCDQWRGECLSSVGHPTVQTPNADALASHLRNRSEVIEFRITPTGD